MTRGIALALALATLATAGMAAAQTREQQARSHFEAGRTAYEAGRFEEALEQFRAAYEAAPRPLLLYNVGQAADRLRRDDEALEAFDAFLAAVGPNDPNYAPIEARVRAIRAARAAHGDVPPAGPAGGREPSVVPWIIAGAGLALVGAGLPMILVASADAEAVNTAPPGSSWSDYESAANDAGPLSIAGQVMIYVGAAAIAGGLVWGIIDLTSGGGSDTALVIGPGGVAVRGSFR
jgi:tetratricopeptide (TPR) repeat protein